MGLLQHRTVIDPTVQMHKKTIGILLGLLLTVSYGAEPNRQRIGAVVQEAYKETREGWSSDEVLLQSKLNSQFLEHCKMQLRDVETFEFNWTLLNLRKAGKLKGKVTSRRRDSHDAYQHLAEIVARTLQDKHKTTIDRIMCDSELRTEFDKHANLLAQDVKPYLMRKAAFGLRKKRRLRPELVLKVADWSRVVSVHTATQILGQNDLIPESPGIYLFRDQSGYLYIGESNNLRSRLMEHLDGSDRKSLANYLRDQGIKNISIEVHAFPSDSRARKVTVRRAYESELIASRKPRFNVRP